MFQAIAGHDANDHHSSGKPVADYRPALDGRIGGVKVGLISELLDSGIVDREVVEATRQTATEMERLGAVVEEVSIPILGHARAISQTIT